MYSVLPELLLETFSGMSFAIRQLFCFTISRHLRLKWDVLLLRSDVSKLKIIKL